VTIEWSARAERDTALLYAYIAADDEAAARNVLAGLYTAIWHLVQYPSMGRLSRDPRYRELIIDRTSSCIRPPRSDTHHSCVARRAAKMICSDDSVGRLSGVCHSR
jgi:plasmid stabilization system protein ParE